MQPEKVNANANKVHTKAKFHLKYMEDDNISSIHGVLPTVNRYRLIFSFTVYRQ